MSVFANVIPELAEEIKDLSLTEETSDVLFNTLAQNPRIQQVTAEIARARNIPELAQWLATSMETSPLLDWPQYKGLLGEDSAGGTKLSNYIWLNRNGLLTLGSQDGFCDLKLDPIHQKFLNFVNLHRETNQQLILEEVKGGREEQRSYVDLVMPLDRFADIVTLVLEQDELDVFVLHHPCLADAFVYKIDNSTGVLIQLSRWPTATTTEIQLVDGRVVEFPAPLGREQYDRPISTFQDLIRCGDDARGYWSEILSLFTDWRSSVVDRLQIHRDLLSDMAGSKYASVLFVAKEKCTIPRSAAVMLREAITVQPPPPREIEFLPPVVSAVELNQYRRRYARHISRRTRYPARY
jgi:hypothetical protein